MKRNKNTSTYLALILVVALMAACTPNAETENNAGLANPAAVYCEGLGYTLEMVERDGGQDADCVFPDGSRCAQWDFLGGRCGQAYSACELHGGVLEEGVGSIGLCRFADGSTCEEYALFSGDCAPGDNPGEVSGYPVEDEVTTGYPIEDGSLLIHNIEEARDYMAIHFVNQYGLEITEPWSEADVSIDEATASTTVRYVSGSVTLVISSMASAPAATYIIQEASDLSNGFYFRGQLQSDGTVLVDDLNLRGTVLNAINARDAVLAFLVQKYELPAFGEWSDMGSQPGDDDDRVTTVWSFTAEGWRVEVEFEPAAPLVSVYEVEVEDNAGTFKWEGEITMYGEITEGSVSR